MPKIWRIWKSYPKTSTFLFLSCILNWLFSWISSVKSLVNMEKTILIASGYPTTSTCTHNLCFIWEDRSFCKFLTTVPTKLRSIARCWCERIWHNVWSWFNPYCKLVFRLCFRIYLVHYSLFLDILSLIFVPWPCRKKNLFCLLRQRQIW